MFWAPKFVQSKNIDMTPLTPLILVLWYRMMAGYSLATEAQLTGATAVSPTRQSDDVRFASRKRGWLSSFLCRGTANSTLPQTEATNIRKPMQPVTQQQAQGVNIFSVFLRYEPDCETKSPETRGH